MAVRNIATGGASAKRAIIGFLGATTPTVWHGFVEAFEQGLRRRGWVDGANVDIDYEWAEGNRRSSTAIAKKFARSKVDVIVTSGTAPALAAKAAAQEHPDRVRGGGRSATGPGFSRRPARESSSAYSNRQTELAIDRLDRLHRVVPKLKRLGILGNGGVKNVNLEMDKGSWRGRSSSRSRPWSPMCAKPAEIAPKIKAMRGKVDALFVCTDPFVTTHHIAINIAAAAADLPTIHAFREYVEGGGLASYGPDFRVLFEGAADLVDQILRGAGPRQIDVRDLKPEHELVINRSTAKALGVKIPKGLKATMIG